jgi:trigger factor
LNGRVKTQVEELSGDRVRLTVEVPAHDLHHAVEHAASDLASSVKIPGFRKGKVPMPVLVQRIGKERLMAEAVESHIANWFWGALASTKVRPAAHPQYDYELPDGGDADWRFSATVAVQPKPQLPDWKTLEVPYQDPQVPDSAIGEALELVQSTVAELSDVDGRAAQPGDTLVVDLVQVDGGTAERDYVVDLGAGRLLEEIEGALIGMSAGDRKQVSYELGDGSTRTLDATVKEIKERVLPPLDDELARAASEFDTLDELRADLERTIREQLTVEADAQFRRAVADRLTQAAKVNATGPLVETRANELLRGLARSLEQRGIDAGAYLQLTGQTPQQLQQRMHAEASRAVGQELVLEAVADELGLEVTDEEVRETLERQGEESEAVEWALSTPETLERIKEDLRLRKALDRVAGEVQRIEPDLAEAREKLWTPEQPAEQEAAATGEKTIWTPGS